jgi:hypothetical protein
LAPLHPRRRHHAFNSTSLLRYLFPHTRQRLRVHISKFRYQLLPSLRHRAHSRIYNCIVRRQLLKQQRGGGILNILRTHGRALGRRSKNEDSLLSRSKMSSTGGLGNSSNSQIAQDEGAPPYQGREPGARRKKFAGYLRAANELRQSYQSSWTANREQRFDVPDQGMPGAFPDSAVVKNGDTELLLFPSYARRHVKKEVSRCMSQSGEVGRPQC